MVSIRTAVKSFLFRSVQKVLVRRPISSIAIESKREQIPNKFNSFPFQYHEEINVLIEDITNLGYGVGRYGPDRWVTMVPNVIVGELVRVKIYQNHKTYSLGDLVTVLQPSPNRIDPPCKFFAKCGGCQYQHMTIEYQHDLKRNQVKTCLQKIASIDHPVNEVVGSHMTYGYRSKITPHFQLPRKKCSSISIGFQSRSSNSTVDIDECIITTPSINKKLKEFRHILNESYYNNTFAYKRGATLLFRQAGVSKQPSWGTGAGDSDMHSDITRNSHSTDGDIELKDEDYMDRVYTNNADIMTEQVNNISFQFLAGEFFQNNPYVTPLLVDHVCRQATGYNNGCTYLLDIYCGSGLFSLCCAHLFDRVVSIEVSSQAIAFAKKNCEQNNITNISFHQGSAEKLFDSLVDSRNGTAERGTSISISKDANRVDPDKTVAIIDPPRKGCDDVFLNQLFTFGPRQIIYVSCDPATQARDAKSIVTAGYRVVDVTPFDMFPQTRHMENVITFVRD